MPDRQRSDSPAPRSATAGPLPGQPLNRSALRSLPQLLDRDLVCIDLETTGGNPTLHRIIEVGLVTIDRDGTIEEWSSLVHPGCRIPAGIAAFTGIDDALVEGAPAFEDLHRELLRRLEGRLFVAHNARFDYGFVKAELARLDVRWQARTLCTVKLSRRLHPEHARHNLDALIERHQLGCEARHRALGDARVLRDLLSVYATAEEPERLLAAARAVLADVALPPQLPADLADELPESPGVYRFLGDNGALLYVGKSKNVRARVLAHFGAAARGSRERALSAQVREVRWEETAGELGALLAEARLVKTARPLHNRRLRDSGVACTLKLAAPPGGGAVGATVEELADLDLAGDAECYGVFRTRRDARQALEQIARAQGLCLKALGLEAAEGSCFGYQLGRCRGVCVGAEPALLHDTRVRLALAASRLRPWPYAGRIAIRERDWRGREDLHVVAGWRYLGTVHEQEEVALLADPGHPFDIDVYRLLQRHLVTAPRESVLEAGPCRRD